MNEKHYKFNKIQFRVSTNKKEIDINTHTGDIAMVNKGEYKCYKYEVKPNNTNENLIITTDLFAGHAKLFVTAGENLIKKNENPLGVKRYFEIDVSEVIKISPSDREYKGKIEKDVYICMWGMKTTSYYIRVMMESELETHQGTNILFNSKFINLTCLDVEISGYLPANKTTKYYVSDNADQKDLKIILKRKAGYPELLGYFCENVFTDLCYFNKKIIKAESKLFI